MEIVQSINSEEIALLNKDVHEIHVSLYPEYFKEYDFDDVNEFFKKIMSDPIYYFYIVKDEGQSLGYVWVETREYPENVFMKSYRSVYIHQLGVSKEHRNKGVGSLIMNWINNFAKENEVNTIQLDYWADNEGANHFYTKNGFKSYRNYLYKGVD
ncbi:GNAT family N-acetyltransferase [Paenibacillus sp. JZ16]|uniref:GNAT family N-acetyltransferase n=1 Tax=Paenibacillus sp. JZ16 TaxID=1906272 RepID=UPI00188D4270|nr:GNAT family N-acetyltransferase [Paenibacillus sp. JZ16]